MYNVLYIFESPPRELDISPLVRRRFTHALSGLDIHAPEQSHITPVVYSGINPKSLDGAPSNWSPLRAKKDSLSGAVIHRIDETSVDTSLPNLGSGC